MKPRETMYRGRYISLFVYLLIPSLLLLNCMVNHSKDHISDQQKKPNIISSETDSLKAFISKVPLYEKEFLGKVVTESGKDWVLVAGRSCEACDEELSIFIYPILKTIDSLKGSRYSYPGEMYSYEDNELVADRKAYFGDCFGDGNSSVVWVQRESGGQDWIESIFLVEFLEGRIDEKFIPHDSSTIKKIRKQIEKGMCFEIQSVQQSTSP